MRLHTVKSTKSKEVLKNLQGILRMAMPSAYIIFQETDSVVQAKHMRRISEALNVEAIQT